MRSLLSRCLFAVALLGACKRPGEGGSGDQSKAKRDVCGATSMVLAQAESYLRTQTGKAKLEPGQEVGLAGRIASECNGTGWTDDAATCFGATTGPADLPECNKKLTPAQKVSYDRAVAEAIASLTGRVLPPRTN